jgi:enoyl-[acyl-carrier protein] reductase II
MNAAPALSGQSVGLISEIKPVKEIIEDTINEYNLVCSNLKPIT